MRILAIAAFSLGCAARPAAPADPAAADDLPPPGATLAADPAPGVVAGPAEDGVGTVWREDPAVIDQKVGILRELVAVTDGAEQLELRARLFELLTDAADPRQQAEGLALGAAVVADARFATLATADRVLILYAEALGRAGRAAEAPALWQRLIRDYPKSRWVGSAYAALGDRAFDDGDLAAALGLYQRALPDPTVGGYARYKRAWTYWNMAQHEQALADFVEVVRTGREPLRREARKDVVRVYAEVGAPDKAEAFFGALDRAGAGLMLLRLAEHYGSIGKYREAAATYARAQPQVDAASACRAQVGQADAAWWLDDRDRAAAAMAAVVTRAPDPACADAASVLAVTIAEALTVEARALRGDRADAIAAWVVARTLAPAGPRRADAALGAAALATEHAAAVGTGAAWAAAAEAHYEAALAGVPDAGPAALEAWRQAVARDPALAVRAAAGQALLEQR